VKKNIDHLHPSAIISSVKFAGTRWLRRVIGLASQCERFYGKKRNLALLGMKLTHPARTCLLALTAWICGVSEEKSPFDYSPVSWVWPSGLLWLRTNSYVNSWRNAPWRCLRLYKKKMDELQCRTVFQKSQRLGLVSFWIYIWHFKANDRNDQQIL
jgi:hypothetical protein